MNLPIVIPAGALTTRLRAIQEDQRRTRPMRAPGVLVRQTPNGVMRKAIAGAKTTGATASPQIPRWL